MTTFWLFFARRYPPLKYLIYVPLLCASVFSTLAPLRDSYLPGVVTTTCGAVAVFVLLFFYRVVDEVKDLGYDRVFNPSRPLVTGKVTTTDIRRYLAVSAVVVLALSAVAGSAPLFIAAGAMAYSLFLRALERHSRVFADSMWGNIVVTIQLKTIVVCYILALGGSMAFAPGVLLVMSYVLAYLHWEIARKTVRPTFAVSGEKLYSSATGPAGAMSVATMLLVIACALQAAVAAWWEAAGPETALLVVPIPVALWGAIKLAGTKDRRYAPGGPTLLAYVVFLVFSALRALFTIRANM